MNEQVFISYSSRDSERAEEMAGILRANGISCWKAPESIPPGGNYNIEIPKGIERCPIFLVLLSENAASSEYVPNELDLAKTEHKYIIPVKIAEYDPYVFKLALVNKQVYPWEDMERIVSQIREQLRMPRAAAHRPPSAPANQRTGPYSHAAGTNFVKPPQAGGGGANGRPPQWIKWAVVACVVAVVGMAGYLGLSGGLSEREASGGSFGGGRDKNSVVSAAPSDGPEEYSEAAASAAPSAAPSDEPEEPSEAVVSAAPSDEPEPAPPEAGPTKLIDMHAMASDHATIQKNATNTVGETYDKAVYLYCPPLWTYIRKPYIKFYLGGQYSLFTGTVSCPDDARCNSSYKFQVFLDDELAAELPFGRATPPTPLEIDVSGCQVITFCLDTPQNVGAMIPDGLLTP